MLVFLVFMIWMSVHEKENNSPLPKKLEKAMKLTRMKEHHDNDYDYSVRYPSFFEQTPDSLLDKGCNRFSFWQDSTEIVQTAFVEENADSLTLDQAMAKYASALHATRQQKGDGFFILSGHIHTDSGAITSRRFHAKFVQHRKLWFVQALVYPEDCEQAMKRLIREIDGWQVWSKQKNRLLFSHILIRARGASRQALGNTPHGRPRNTCGGNGGTDASGCAGCSHRAKLRQREYRYLVYHYRSVSAGLSGSVCLYTQCERYPDGETRG